MKDMKDHPLLLGLVLLLAASASAAAQDAKIEAANELIVNVSNIQHTDGRIGCTLFSAHRTTRTRSSSTPGTR
jgi:uncharacterized protein (DUF2141 family)